MNEITRTSEIDSQLVRTEYRSDEGELVYVRYTLASERRDELGN
jgi:hypothetical protein